MAQLVLAIEPDLRQAAIVKRIVREKVHADVAVVDSRDAALEAMRSAVPDVLLLSTLLSPRDEDELIAHLRTLEQAQHLQTHTIPQLASSIGAGDGESRGSRGLLGAFRRKKSEIVANGCDPDLFAEEIRSYLRQASNKKRELQELAAAGHSLPAAPTPLTTSATTTPPAAQEESAPAQAAGSSWASPFEWKPKSNPSSLIADPESLIAHPESRIPDPILDPIRDPILDPIPNPIPESIEFDVPAADVKRERRPLETVNLWRDSGFAMRDSGSADQGSGISDSILADHAVSEAIMAVTGAVGCRVRRVLVAAAA